MVNKYIIITERLQRALAIPEPCQSKVMRLLKSDDPPKHE